METPQGHDEIDIVFGEWGVEGVIVEDNNILDALWRVAAIIHETRESTAFAESRGIGF
jgi:hypothetical protein